MKSKEKMIAKSAVELLQCVVAGDFKKAASLLRTCNAKEIHSYGILHATAKSGNAELMSLILGMPGLDVNQFHDPDDTALHVAVQWDRIDVGILLLRAGANVNLCNQAGNSAFHCAILSEREEFVRLFLTGLLSGRVEGEPLKLNPEVNSFTGNRSPLMLAAASDNANIVTLLLDNKAEVNCVSVDEIPLTPIHLAIESASPNTVQLLLRRGAMLNHSKLNTPQVLDFLVQCWKINKEAKNLDKLNHLRQCAEILLFHGAGIGVSLPAEMREMKLRAFRCCLFNATMLYRDVDRDILIDVNLRTQYPTAIHTVEELSIDHVSALAQSAPLPYPQLLYSIDLQLGLRGRGQDNDIEKLYRVREHLYRRAPSQQGGMSLWRSVLYSAKSGGTMNDLVHGLNRLPSIPEFIINELMLLEQIPDTDPALRSLQCERETYSRVLEFSHKMQAFRERARQLNTRIETGAIGGGISIFSSLLGIGVLSGKIESSNGRQGYILGGALFSISLLFFLAMLFIFILSYRELRTIKFLTQPEHDELHRFLVDRFHLENGSPYPEIPEQILRESALQTAHLELSFWRQRRTQAMQMDTRTQGQINFLIWRSRRVPALPESVTSDDDNQSTDGEAIQLSKFEDQLEENHHSRLIQRDC